MRYVYPMENSLPRSFAPEAAPEIRLQSVLAAIEVVQLPRYGERKIASLAFAAGSG
jgi:hypothetical protein